MVCVMSPEELLPADMEGRAVKDDREKRAPPQGSRLWVHTRCERARGACVL